MPLNTPDLYRLSIKEAEFTAYCGGNLGGDNETCVTVATIPGVTEAFVIRDNKPGATNVDLRFTGSEMDTWAIKWVRERGLTV